MLVNVHIVGSVKNLADHLKGVKMRQHVVRLLISSLRHPGWPGYEEDGINNPAAVERWIHKLYVKPYEGQAKFIQKIKLPSIQRRVRDCGVRL